jgi:hypothetical protein
MINEKVDSPEIDKVLRMEISNECDQELHGGVSDEKCSANWCETRSWNRWDAG